MNLKTGARNYRPSFRENKPKRSFCITENERFGLIYVKTGSINSGTVARDVHFDQSSPSRNFVRQVIRYSTTLLFLLRSNIISHLNCQRSQSTVSSNATQQDETLLTP